ncbi:MAG TPA: HWE histidine kinase domain-containing protein [Devosia sp.]|nr:HWE histidine kinase domain-containing protein [Devosia sp.]
MTPTAQATGGTEIKLSKQRSWARSRPIGLYLVALVLVIIIPALFGSLVLLNRAHQAQRDVVRSLTNATVQAIGQSVEREIAGMVTTLRLLSSSTSLERGDLEEFHARGLVALAGTGAYLVALDEQFQMLLNTRVRFGEPLGPTADPVTAAAALERGTATISGVFYGPIAQQWLYSVFLTVPDAEDVTLLAINQTALGLTPALQSRQLPPGWNAALVDAQNLVITATPSADLLPGTLFPLLRTAEEPSEPWRYENMEGRSVVTSEWRAPTTGWRVIAWADAATVDAAFTESLLWLVAWGVLIGVVAALLAFHIGQRIGLSVRGLRQDALKLGHGEPVTARPYPVAEIAEVSRALADASKERRAAEQEVNFLMRELAHRSKNQMTVIAAMAKQTARGAENVETYVQAFERRIMGLSRSTDLLLAHGRAGISLRELIENQLAPFCPTDPERVTLSGADLRLNMQAAQILGMAVHELSTNAVKYGAFRGDDGQLTITWLVVDDALDFSWRETVQDATPPQDERVGFGTKVLKAMVGSSLGAQVDRLSHADGIEWHFVIPLEGIDPGRMPEAPHEAQDE